MSYSNRTGLENCMRCGGLHLDKPFSFVVLLGKRKNNECESEISDSNK